MSLRKDNELQDIKGQFFVMVKWGIVGKVLTSGLQMHKKKMSFLKDKRLLGHKRIIFRYGQMGNH